MFSGGPSVERRAGAGGGVEADRRETKPLEAAMGCFASWVEISWPEIFF
jgi:hypothetical protein